MHYFYQQARQVVGWVGIEFEQILNENGKPTRPEDELLKEIDRVHRVIGELSR